MSGTSQAVFISYASQDAEAANRICEALRAAGIEVWLDRSELRGGDAWDQKIRREIRDCSLFIPLISANTAARAEGYFRLEWSLAEARSHMIARNKAFIVPVCLDQTLESGADVPESFQRVQWTRLPRGDTPPAFTARIAALLGAPVAASGSTSVPVTPTGEVRVASAKFTPRVPLAATALATLVAVGLAYVVFERFQLSKQTPADRHVAAVVPTTAVPAIPAKSVAVLPFVDMSEKKDQEYFADGLSEELIDKLTKVSDLRVPARTSSFYFKGKSADIPTIARRLMVAHVLEGSIRKSGSRLRVTAQLVRADNGYHLWSETYDRNLNDIFKVQDEIADAVVKALKVSLLGNEGTKTQPTANLEAYSLYVQARAMVSRGTVTDIAKAAEYLQRAIRLDPKFAPAWALLNATSTLRYEMGLLPFEQARDEARRGARQALEFGPTLGAAHLSMARVHYFFDWDWQAAQDEIQRARELDPSDADALRWAGISARNLGHVNEAISLFQQAADLDPLDGANYAMLGDANVADGSFAAAELAYRKTLEVAPGGFGAPAALAAVLLANGQPSAALAAFDKLEDEDDRESGRALAYFALGQKAESDAALRNLETRFANTDAYSIAVVHVYRGEVDEAFRWLDRAYSQRDRNLDFINTDWDFRKLRGDPRYKAFLRKMNLPE